MPYPTPPAISTDYSAKEQALGNGTFPGQELDADLAGIVASIEELVSALKAITRSDGKLANGSVTTDTLAASVRIGFDPPSVWATAQAYTTRSTVFSGYGFYLCTTAHTSGVFATDLAAGRWQLLADLTPPAGALQASNNLSDVPDKPQARANMGLGTAATYTVGTGSGQIRDNAANEALFLEAADASLFATAAQGALAASAVQPGRQVLAGTGLTGGGTLAADRTLAVDVASNADVDNGTAGKIVPATVLQQKRSFTFVQASLSGINTYELTTIPSWAEEIVINLGLLDISGTSHRIGLGDSAGSYSTNHIMGGPDTSWNGTTTTAGWYEAAVGGTAYFQFPSGASVFGQIHIWRLSGGTFVRANAPSLNLGAGSTRRTYNGNGGATIAVGGFPARVRLTNSTGTNYTGSDFLRIGYR